MQENEETLKQNIAFGFLWKALENGGDQLITFLVSLVLARFLGPEKYGTMTLMLVFVTIAQVIIQSGFQTALIQRKEITEADINSVFWTGLLISAVLYGLLYGMAPGLAAFFGDAEIAPMLRVLSLILFFGAVGSVEMAIIARNMRFRSQCVAMIISGIVSGIVGIAAAYKGLGTWALVLQQLVKHFGHMSLLFFMVPWKPKLMFSAKRLGALFSYGWKVLVSGLIDTIYNNLYTPIISKLYAPVMVGYYGRGNQFPQILANAMAQTMQSVMLPAFSKVQEEKARLRGMLRRTVKLGSFVMAPMMAGLMAVAEPMVALLLGEAWLPCVPFLRLCCLSYCVWPMHVANLQAINAEGRSDIYLKLEILKKCVGMAVLCLSIPFGVLTMIFLKAVFDFICTVINACPNRRLCGYGPGQQWRDVLPEFLLSGIMGIGVYAVQPVYCSLLAEGFNTEERLLSVTALPSAQLALCLLIQILFGMLIYIGLSALFKMESFMVIKESLKEMRGKKSR